MIKTDELFAEAISLPIEMRTQLVDELLRSFNPTQHCPVRKLHAKAHEFERVKKSF